MLQYNLYDIGGNGLKGKVLLAVILVLVLLTVPSLPLGLQRPASQQRFDTASPEDIPGKDSDLDGLTDKQERALGTNPFDPDTDHDHFWDGAEYNYYEGRQHKAAAGVVGPDGLSLWLKGMYSLQNGVNRTGPLGDADGDGKPNLLDRDSDGDGIPDGIEIDVGLDPLDTDTDHDGVPDNVDRNPLLNQDSNHNGVPDDYEDYLKASSHDSSSDTADPLDRPDKATLNDVLFYVEPVSDARYWRMKAYDQFDGSIWHMTETTLDAYYGGLLGTGISGPIPGHEVSYRITYNGSTIGYVPTALYTTRLWKMDPSSSFVYTDAYSNFLTKGDIAHSYNFSAFAYEFPLSVLNASAPGNDPSMGPYLQVPQNISGRVRALALELGAKATTPYGKAMVIADFLSQGYKFNYNAASPSSTERSDLMDWFLFKAREGRSPEFATALVLLLRLNNVPARLAEGYAIGDVVDGRRVVRNGHAHSWGEVYLYGVGWVSLEATGNNVSPQGATGVSSSGDDSSVSSGTHNGAGTGGGTTSSDPSSNVTNVTTLGSITLRSDKDPVWKGDLFHIYGTVDGAGLPRTMNISIYLERNIEDGTSDEAEGTVLAGKGQVHDGQFTVICSPDLARVGPNRVLASAEGQTSTTMLLTTRPEGALNLTVMSKTAFAVEAPNTFMADDIAIVKFALQDLGGLIIGNRSVDLGWASRSFSVQTEEPAAAVSLIVTEPVGYYPLTLDFAGDRYLSGTTWNKTIEVNDTKSLMTVSLDPPSTTLTVGDSRDLLVALYSSNLVNIDEPVNVSLDKVFLASGNPNGLPIHVTFKEGLVAAGDHKLTVTYNGSADHPMVSSSLALKVIGKTSVLLSAKRITLGQKAVMTPVLVDNLRKPLSGMSLEMSWVYNDRRTGHLSTMTDDSGKATLSLDTVGEEPGKINLTVAFKGSPYYKGAVTSVQLTLGSPTVLIVDFPARLVREREFSVLGHLYDLKGRGLPDLPITFVFDNMEIGEATTFSDGSFLFRAQPTTIVPLGPSRFSVRFDGTDTLDPAYNTTNVTVFGMSQIRIDGPGIVDIGREYRYTITLMDDHSNPLSNRSLVVNITNGAKGHKTLVTDAKGKAHIKVLASATDVTINATFPGEGYLLSGSGLKVSRVSLWDLLGILAGVIATITIVMVVVNYIYNKRQLKGAQDAIARAEGIRTTDRYRRAIFQTYKAMSRLFERKGLVREGAQTVREYETVVSEGLPVDKPALGAVTGVFEEARYSDHRLGEVHVKKAKKGYNRIDKELRSVEKQSQGGIGPN